jgi:hypothetical protein
MDNSFHLISTYGTSYDRAITPEASSISLICEKYCSFTGQQTIEQSPVRLISRLRLLCDVLVENKELIMGPALTLIPQLFSLPLFIVSVVFVCQEIETSSLRYFLIASSLTSFIPQLTTFFLYISPSSFYTQEWQTTNIRKWLHGLKIYRRQVPPSTNAVVSTRKDTSEQKLTKSN